MINSFEWNFRTHIYFGQGEEGNVGKYADCLGKKVLIVHGGEPFLKQSGVWGRATASLEEAGVSYIELSGIQANPRVDKVRTGIAMFREFEGTGLLAIGGGSVIDTAKAIAAGANYDGDVWDLFTGKGDVIDPPPVGVILTTAAAGSEGSIGAVITNPETQEKFDILNPVLRPAFAILNPEITATVPAYQTACGVTDILSHAMERYFTNTEGVELTDRLGEALMKTVVNNGLILKDNPADLTARSQIMWAATLAHNGILEGGRNGCWASHMIGTELSAAYDTTHGATLSVITPAWMKYVYQADVERFARFANKVFDVEWNIENPEITAQRGIDQLIHFYKLLGMPTTLGEIGAADPEKFEAMATTATRFGPVGCIKKLEKEDVVNIYKLAL